MADSEKNGGEDFPWHLGVYDAHCHPTDTMDSIEDIPKMKARVLTVMATRAQDQDLVIQVAKELGVKDLSSVDEQTNQRMIPSFGWHPWFSHQLFDDDSTFPGTTVLDKSSKVAHYQSVLTPKSDDEDFLLSLPDPRPFSTFLKETRQNLERFQVSVVGEIGLDKSFRIPYAWLPEHYEQRDDSLTPGGREGRRLSPYHVSMDHQKKVLVAQLKLAGELDRPVSIHSVQTHGIVFDVLSSTWKGYERHVPSKRERRRQARGDATGITFDSDDEENGKIKTKISRPYPPRVCLHSYSGPPEPIKQYLDPAVPSNIFFSFSTAINFSGDTADKVEASIKAIPDDNLLIESDLHIAGIRMDDHLEDIVRIVCTLKGWTLDEGVKILGRNWKRFVFGT